MTDYSLFDVIGGRPERYDTYDQPNVGPTPVLQQPQAQANQSWTDMLGKMAQQWTQGQGSGAPMASMPAARASGSSQGFLSNSRQGLDIGTLMKIASMAYGGGMMPAAAPAAGAMGGGASMAPGAAATGGASGGMGGMFGGIMGSGSQGAGGLSGILGGYQGKDVPRPTFAEMPPVNRNPLIPQGVNAFDIRNYPQPY